MEYPPQCEHGKNKKTRKKHRHKFTSRVYLQRWAHHRQSSGGSKSYSNVGSTILPRDINNCGFHTASMTHNEVKLTLTRHDQSINSSVPYEEFCQLAARSNASQTWTSMNHLTEYQLCNIYMKFLILTRNKRNITSAVWDGSPENYTETTKNPTSSSGE